MKKWIYRLKKYFAIQPSFLFLLSIVLLGVFFGSLCVRLMGSNVLPQLSSLQIQCDTVLSARMWIDIACKEFLFIIILLVFCYLPYGMIGMLLTLLYKGFSLGVVAGGYSYIFGVRGIAMISVHLLLPNLFYLFAICFLADTYIRLFVRQGQSVGKHYTGFSGSGDEKEIFCVFLTVVPFTVLGILTEIFICPFLQNIFL